MANTQQITNNITKAGYVAFDAMSLRQLIINRLNETGVYTDQNFIGSNLASIIDIVSYAFNTLIYYLNRTSTESMFTEAQLYENINRIVKLIDYKPVGFQTSTLNFSSSAVNLPRGQYTIPRYAYVTSKNNNIAYSFNEDITFTKTTDLVPERLTELTNEKFLFQGRYIEYPLYIAAGEENETIIVDNAGDLIDHFNIDVYVKPNLTNKWKQYLPTPNLYLENATSEKYEIRLNGNGRYEIKFGNNINGIKLNTGDQVAIYYLVSNGSQGEIGPRELDGATALTKFETLQLNQILEDISEGQFRFLTSPEMYTVKLLNETSSTVSQIAETAEQIRESAPAAYRSQYRLVTARDYQNFVLNNFSYFVSDIKAVNNWSYVSEYLKYFYDIGLNSPEQTERALYNQIQFSDSCNFNNVYLVIVPKTAITSSTDYLTSAQKEAINNEVQKTKLITTETTFIDPVYKAVTFCPNLLDREPNTSDISSGSLVIVKQPFSQRENQTLINDVAAIIRDYFSKANMRLQQSLDISVLSQRIQNINGIESIYTSLADNPEIKTQGLSFLVWNPQYFTNDRIVTQNIVTSRFFEYFYFHEITTIQNRIKVLQTNSILRKAEY